MLERVTNLPNYCNGKIYKRWSNVTSLYEGGGILASKTGRDGKPVELLISENGTKRELYSAAGKVMDIIDASGIKRTFIYHKKENEIHGSMILAPAADGVKPLVTFAKWVTEGLIPKHVELDINPKHKASNIFIPHDIVKGTSTKVVKVRAENFEDISYPLPKNISFTTESGEVKTVQSAIGSDNIHYANQFSITPDGEPGANLRVFV